MSDHFYDPETDIGYDWEYFSEAEKQEILQKMLEDVVAIPPDLMDYSPSGPTTATEACMPTHKVIPLRHLPLRIILSHTFILAGWQW